MPGAAEHFGKLVEVNVGQDNTRPADRAWIEAIAGACREHGVRFDGRLITKGERKVAAGRL